MSYVRVSTPLKIVPLKISAPVDPPVWSETLCGTPASLFSNWIWNGVPAGAVSVSCSYLMPTALITTRLGLPELLGAGALDGAGAYVQPASAEVHAATRTTDRRAADRRRAGRMGGGAFRGRGSRDSTSEPNLPRRTVSCRPVRAERSRAVRIGRWYWWVPVPSTNGPVVALTTGHIGSQ